MKDIAVGTTPKNTKLLIETWSIKPVEDRPQIIGTTKSGSVYVLSEIEFMQVKDIFYYGIEDLEDITLALQQKGYKA